MKKYPGRVYIIYPPQNLLIKEKRPWLFETINSILLNSTIVKQYIKINNPKSASRIDDLKSCHITSNVRILFDMKVYHPWNLLQMLLNIFLEYRGSDNIAVILAYTSMNCMLYCENLSIERYQEREKKRPRECKKYQIG